MRTIAICNMKGGVAKTTTVINKRVDPMRRKVSWRQGIPSGLQQCDFQHKVLWPGGLREGVPMVLCFPVVLIPGGGSAGAVLRREEDCLVYYPL